jgi:glyoxylate/hydroxypyruvate reductase A
MKLDQLRMPIPFVAAADYAQTNAWVQALQQAMPDERVVAFDQLSESEKQSVTVAIVANPDPANLLQMPALKWVHSVWAGVERLVADLGQSQLKIVRLVDPQLAETMAEAVLAWTLYLHREMPAYARQQKNSQWLAREYIRPQSKTVSLLGLGALGEAAAKHLLTAGFQVCGWSRSQKNIVGVDCFSGESGLSAMFARTNILVCLLPLTPDTRGLLNAARLAQLPKGASLVNFARGALVQDDDLQDALNAQHLQHAVLDVFETEPLPIASWHWQHPQVTVLPHISAPTDKQTASAIVAGNIRRYRDDGSLPLLVDVAKGY